MCLSEQVLSTIVGSYTRVFNVLMHQNNENKLHFVITLHILFKICLSAVL